ncbi:MAG: hypothetical protein QF516_16085, partial [Pirellulaceae bacterium]|nr:hypothetical protein [Pirellulaceae bacterium]
SLKRVYSPGIYCPPQWAWVQCIYWFEVSQDGDAEMPESTHTTPSIPHIRRESSASSIWN